MVEKLGELADKGEELKRTGEFDWQHEGKNAKGIYGVSVKVGLGEQGDKDVKVEPFGNIRQNETTGEAVVQEVREPITDVFEEDDHILVVAEMPGISANDVQIESKDDVLTFTAEHGDKKYHKELLLPRNCPKDKIQIACNNGVLEIRCPK
ncbi:MAG: Hsp20/alpha crystallin family protein [Pseudomonadota bacterium]